MEERRAQRRRYNNSPKGVARNLRAEHDLDGPGSVHWADQMFDQNTRCAICGLPTYMLAVYRERGWPWFLGRRFGSGSHPRLTLDHVVPGSNEELRLLCHLCNSLRGARRLSDEEVLVLVRKKWHWYCGLRFLWWLNTSPGVGGRLHRSARCAKRDAQFAAEASPEGTVQSNETSTPSPSPTPSANSAE